ncbi:MAG: glycosyltransferase family 39 protein [Rhizobiaceae bacterium]|nr:glycosyltransferase family 39 protein [Rhizobiaceae bacterium]
MRDAAKSGAGDADRAAPALIVAFVLLWTAYATFGRYNLDIHGDMVENYAWGIAWQLGYHKHPPLFSWVAAAWFEIFPRERVFYHLLASVNVGVAIHALWRLSRRFLDANQQVLLVSTTFFLPPLTFLAANYNATSAMLPFWALTALFYVRTLERRRIVDAVLAGAFLGLAMLAKYHSLVLVLALAAHLLLDRRARPLLATPLPWIAACAGIVVLAPHLGWLVREDFPTLRYAADQGDGLGDALLSALRFIPVLVLYTLPAFIFLASFRRFRDGLPLLAAGQLTALRATPEGTAMLALMVLPVAFTIGLGILTQALLSSLWTIPFFATLPLAIVLCLPKQAARTAPTRGVAVVAAYCVVLLAVAPFARQATLDRARGSAATPLSIIAEQAQNVWRERTGQRLSIVAGMPAPVVNAFAFYASDRPYAVQAMSLQATPWVTPAMIAEQGALSICAKDEASCGAAARLLLGRVDETVSLSVPAVDGAGGPRSWDYDLHLRRPGQP